MKKILLHNLLAISLVVVLLLIFLVKGYGRASSDPLLYAYAIAVTLFELSRVTGSFFYGHRVRNGKYEPKVTFVIPVKNEEKAIANTISKCFEADYPKGKLEVVVVNDGSTDGTWREIERMKTIHPQLVAVNWSRNKGKREGMREAIGRASGEIIVQLDSDSYLEPNSLKKLVRHFKDPKIGAVCAHTDPSNTKENLLTRMQHAYYFMSFRILKAAESLFDMVFCCSGCCSAYRKELITPLLDEWTNERFLGIRTSWGDDRALTNLLLREGYKTIYADDVQAYTVVPTELRQFLKQQIRWKKGWLVNSIKAATFVLHTDWFVALTYFFPLILITLLTPIVAFKALIYNPLVLGISPWYYITGVILISALLAINYRLYRSDGYWKYIFVWTFLNMTVLSYILVYALFDLRNTKWGTR